MEFFFSVYIEYALCAWVIGRKHSKLSPFVLEKEESGSIRSHNIQIRDGIFKLLTSPGIDSQPGVPARQATLAGGIDSLAS
jgi:hypothetical protein